MSVFELQNQISERSAQLAVIGLGYVGLPVACVLAQAGFQVLGLDLKADRVARINAGQNPIEGEEPGLAEILAEVVAAGRLQATTDYRLLASTNVILIDVETPVDDNHTPRYEALRAACSSLATVMQEGALVIIESTISPGTLQTVVRPLLEAGSGRRAGEDFYLGTCPERVMPGRLLRNLRQMSRVCGGTTPETAEAMVTLYRTIVDADLDTADAVTAELVKTAENAYRDVQIAFANEVALICEAAGGDVWRVRELVNKSPGRQMLLPGGGVGGHCIPKDPWLLAMGGQGRVPVRLIPAARAVNDGMPWHVADLVADALQAARFKPDEARVVVLGYAYLEESEDTRNSPSAALVNRLTELGIRVNIHDPWVAEYAGDVLERARGCDASIIMVAHRCYRTLDLGALRDVLARPILVDARRVVNRMDAERAGLKYYGVGIG